MHQMKQRVPRTSPQIHPVAITRVRRELLPPADPLDMLPAYPAAAAAPAHSSSTTASSFSRPGASATTGGSRRSTATHGQHQAHLHVGGMAGSVAGGVVSGGGPVFSDNPMFGAEEPATSEEFEDLVEGELDDEAAEFQEALESWQEVQEALSGSTSHSHSNSKHSQQQHQLRPRHHQQQGGFAGMAQASGASASASMGMSMRASVSSSVGQGARSYGYGNTPDQEASWVLGPAGTLGDSLPRPGWADDAQGQGQPGGAWQGGALGGAVPSGEGLRLSPGGGPRSRARVGGSSRQGSPSRPGAGGAGAGGVAGPGAAGGAAVVALPVWQRRSNPVFEAGGMRTSGGLPGGSARAPPSPTPGVGGSHAAGGVMGAGRRLAMSAASSPARPMPVPVAGPGARSGAQQQQQQRDSLARSSIPLYETLESLMLQPEEHEA